MRKRLYLIEDSAKVFMSKRELLLKKRLINLLKDDGKGNKHSKYAACLAKYDVQIVPADGPNGDPDFTAAISFDEGIIFIGEGFLFDENTFYQLNVLLRHELAHNLLMHQIRMMNEIGEPSWCHIKYSSTLHNLHNIIEDFEISNKKYSEEDKKIIEHMWFNNHWISGLVTESIRKNWKNLSLEEMYHELQKEIADMHQQLLNLQNPFGDGTDAVKNGVSDTYMYATAIGTRINPQYAPEILTKTRGIWVLTKKGKQFVRFPDIVMENVDNLYDNIIKDQPVEDIADTLQDYLSEITKSSPMTHVQLTDPNTGEVRSELYTPEEKYVIVEVIKNVLDQLDSEDTESGDGEGDTENEGDPSNSGQDGGQSQDSSSETDGETRGESGETGGNTGSGSNISGGGSGSGGGNGRNNFPFPGNDLTKKDNKSTNSDQSKSDQTNKQKDQSDNKDDKKDSKDSKEQSKSNNNNNSNDPKEQSNNNEKNNNDNNNNKNASNQKDGKKDNHPWYTAVKDWLGNGQYTDEEIGQILQGLDK